MLRVRPSGALLVLFLLLATLHYFTAVTLLPSPTRPQNGGATQNRRPAVPAAENKPRCNRTHAIRFAHIAKNAGTSIEDAFWQRGVCVGRFSGLRARASCASWHVPPRRAPAIYCGAAVVFCVVRDPIERFVSAFRHHKYRRRKMQHFRHGRECDSADLNAYVLKQLDRRNGMVKNMSIGSPEGCHLLAQTAYLHPNLGGAGGPCGCAHALRQDTLDADLGIFARHHGLGAVTLGRSNSRPGCALAPSDLSDAARRAVETAYADDIRIYAALAAAPYDPDAAAAAVD